VIPKYNLCSNAHGLLTLCVGFEGDDQALLEYTEDYEKQIAQLKANNTKIELAKTSIEEQMLAMTMEQVYSFDNMHILSFSLSRLLLAF
jgi:histidinol dehydrogenase